MAHDPKVADNTERIGVLAIFIAETGSVDPVNHILSEHARLIQGRLGLPHLHRQRDVAVIALIMSATSDEFGALSGKLGQLNGVEVKSLLSKRF